MSYVPVNQYNNFKNMDFIDGINETLNNKDVVDYVIETAEIFIDNTNKKIKYNSPTNSSLVVELVETEGAFNLIKLEFDKYIADYACVICPHYVIGGQNHELDVLCFPELGYVGVIFSSAEEERIAIKDLGEVTLQIFVIYDKNNTPEEKEIPIPQD